MFSKIILTSIRGFIAYFQVNALGKQIIGSSLTMNEKFRVPAGAVMSNKFRLAIPLTSH